MIKTDRIEIIKDERFFYTSGYYVTNKWIDNDTFVAVRSENERMNYPIDKNEYYDAEIVKISLKDNSITSIAKVNHIMTFVEVRGNFVYYTTTDGVFSTDVVSGETTCIYENNIYITEDGYSFGDGERKAVFDGLHLTKSGEYASFFVAGNNRPTVFFRLNMQKGEVEKLYEVMFAKPLYEADHLMISPHDKDLFFFAHEGETFYIPNRLWIYNHRKKDAYNIAKQRLDEKGNVGDCFGHEMWSHDGKGIYFVKYPVSSLKPTGICYADVQTAEYELLYSEFKYWHVGVSQDGRYLLADTQYAPFQSEVVVIDRETGIESVIDMPHMTAIHPCHPHPQMSPDNKKVIYTALDKEGGRTCIKVAYIDNVRQ